MNALIVAGHRVRILERITTAGAVLGLTRATAYRLAESDEWPLVGPHGSRFVSMPALLDRYRVPYELEAADDN